MKIDPDPQSSGFDKTAEGYQLMHNSCKKHA